MKKLMLFSVFGLLMFELSLVLTSCEFKNGEYARQEKMKALDFERSQLAGGEAVFSQNCKQCHHNAGNLSVLRTMGKIYFQGYIENQDSLLRGNDPLALELKRKWGNTGYRHNFKLDNEELTLLIKYMEAQTLTGCN